MQQEPNEGFWNTCYNANGISACATFRAEIWAEGETHPDAPDWMRVPNQFVGGWGDYLPLLINGTQPFRITAWGFQWATPAELGIYYGEDAIEGGDPHDYAPHSFGAWSGFGVNQYSMWDFTVGGPHHEAALMQGLWTDGIVPSLAASRFAWRGESEDHSLWFDCIQAEAGSRECIGNDALNVTTTTPEPSTLALLLTGLALVSLVRRYSRRTVS